MSKVKKEMSNSIDFSTPIVMGILNITTDSFYDGGKFITKDKIEKQIKKIEQEGAKIIDIGASSSRPGSTPVSEKTELNRLIPTIEIIKKITPNLKISIDTFRSKVARECIKNGADIINDISAGELDKNMFETIAELNVPYIMMHMKGTPKNMQNNPQYKNVTVEIINNLSQKIKKAESFNIRDIILDPGFGFGKTTNHNFKLLNDLSLFKNLDRPVLVGISRKSMIYKTLDIKPENALNGTTSLNTIALLNGANILRVHDVKEAKEVIKLYNFGKKNT